MREQTTLDSFKRLGPLGASIVPSVWIDKERKDGSWDQCDQIGRFFIFLVTYFLTKVAQIIW